MSLNLFQPNVVVVTQAGRVGRTLQINKRTNDVLVDFVDGKPQWVDGVGSLCWTDYESIDEYLAQWAVSFFGAMTGRELVGVDPTIMSVGIEGEHRAG